MPTTAPSRSDLVPAAPPRAVEFGGFLAGCVREVEAFLDAALPPEAGGAGTLPGAIRYALLGGGKRIRPALAMAAAVSVGGRARDALAVAGAVEMIHAYSLVHDDLPCMDDDDLRRGQPTVHVRFGEAIAVLAGDALHTLAFETLAVMEAPAAIRLECIRRLAAAAGPGGMAGGQALDIEAETIPPDRAGLEAIHRGKTGALLGAAAALGALGGGGSPGQVEALAAFGAELGLVFQIVDDLLDERETSATLGKAAGKDRARGKASWAAFHGADRAGAEAARRAAAARAGRGGVGAGTAEAHAPAGRRVLHALAARVVNRRS